MAEASSRLDINLEASGKINGVRYISVFSVSKNQKGKPEVGSMINIAKKKKER